MTEQNDFIKLLFDTLKETSNENTSTIQKLVDQQIQLVNTVQSLPISDLKKALDDHNRESSDDINNCTETVESETKSILEKVNELNGKVKLMIGIVCASVVIMGLAYFVARFYVDSVDKQNVITTIEEELEQQQKSEHEKLRDEVIQAIRKEFKKENSEVDKSDVMR